MSEREPAILKFAKKEEPAKNSNSIYKYLADAGFNEEEVKNWGTIGSLMDALKEEQAGQSKPCMLDSSFVDFVSKLPAGNTPKPSIRHQLQRPVQF